MENVFNVVEINAKLVYIFEVKKKRGRRFHYIEIDLIKKGLEVYDSKEQKGVIYSETNFDFIGVSEIQNNGQIFLAES